MTDKQYNYFKAQYIHQYKLKYNAKAKELNKRTQTYDYIQNKILSTPTLLSNMQSAIKKAYKEQELNKAYGKETPHYSEQPRQSITTEYYQPLSFSDVLDDEELNQLKGGN